MKRSADARKLGACVHDALTPCPDYRDGRECDVCPLAKNRAIGIRVRDILTRELEARASAELVRSHEDALDIAAAVDAHCMFDRPSGAYVFRRAPFDQKELGEYRKVLR